MLLRYRHPKRDLDLQKEQKRHFLVRQKQNNPFFDWSYRFFLHSIFD